MKMLLFEYILAPCVCVRFFSRDCTHKFKVYYINDPGRFLITYVAKMLLPIRLYEKYK